MSEEQSSATSIPPIFIVSGGVGASGSFLVKSALAQFQPVQAPIIVVPRVRTIAQIEEVVRRVEATQGTIVHTLVDPNLRHELICFARARNIVAIDIMGQMLSRLTNVLGREPIGQPGLYRQLQTAYFDRVDAIEFAVAHDDGQKPEGIIDAEIVLVGVSRVGKTPLSVYLSTLGWRVANVPFVKERFLPEELEKVQRRRIIGLVIDPRRLVTYRRQRQTRMRVSLGNEYTSPERLFVEVEASRAYFYRRGLHMVDVTEKPIEESAGEVITIINRYYPVENREGDESELKQSG